MQIIGREAERRLVESSSFGRHMIARRPRASAARRPTACPRPEPAAPRRIGNIAKAFSMSSRMPRVVPREGAHLQVLENRQAREDLPALGRLAEAQADDDVRLQVLDLPAVEDDPPERTLLTPEMHISVDVFPAPLAPIIVTISPSVDVERDALQDLDGARSRRGRSRAAGEAASGHLLLAQVGLDDLGIVLDLLGRPLGDLRPVLKHRDAVADAHDDLHVVLDEAAR
jgi:hypothetical protein